jgi:hypothetical protein
MTPRFQTLFNELFDAAAAHDSAEKRRSITERLMRQGLGDRPKKICCKPGAIDDLYHFPSLIPYLAFDRSLPM